MSDLFLQGDCEQDFKFTYNMQTKVASVYECIFLSDGLPAFILTTRRESQHVSQHVQLVSYFWIAKRHDICHYFNV